jgi:hypothetical protein
VVKTQPGEKPEGKRAIDVDHERTPGRRSVTVKAVALIAAMPRLEHWFFPRYGNRVIEPELKGAFAKAQFSVLVRWWC